MKAHNNVVEVLLSRYRTDQETGCWRYTGHIINTGYGTISVNGQSTLTHRLSYELFVGHIPNGWIVDHKCGYRNCFNPDHLRTITFYDNVVTYGLACPSAINARKTQCMRGHPFDDENTMIVTSTGGRRCRVCDRANSKKTHQKRLARERVSHEPA